VITARGVDTDGIGARRLSGSALIVICVHTDTLQYSTVQQNKTPKYWIHLPLTVKDREPHSLQCAFVTRVSSTNKIVIWSAVPVLYYKWNIPRPRTPDRKKIRSPIWYNIPSAPIVESILKQKTLDCLLHNKLISRHQCGFLSNHCICSQLLECVNDWSLAIHNLCSVDVVYINFSKAFDSVCHNKLIRKLESVGVGDIL